MCQKYIGLWRKKEKGLKIFVFDDVGLVLLKWLIDCTFRFETELNGLHV